MVSLTVVTFLRFPLLLLPLRFLFALLLLGRFSCLGFAVALGFRLGLACLFFALGLGFRLLLGLDSVP